ncbi:MAG: SUMF1/EgtB/PvdO family nonheme iron enzyme [Opitutaceae bacterium]|nr:SUMF1/EgtB/PvdO family nonheme iron enzyme [Opitutaceae bacterium]
MQPGAFQMGSPAGEAGRWTDETLHAVTLTQPYYIGVFEITQKQWQLVMGANPSWSFGDRNPVEGVSYENIRGDAAGAGWPASDAVDAGSFFGRLRARTGLPLDLPTEAQWEYAARAGTATALNSGQDLDARAYAGLDALGRHLYNQLDGQGGFDRRHTAAGSYLPNAWGLYDMHGNVREFCLDWYGALPAAPATDPAGPAAGTTRVTRGGGWDSIEDECRSAARGLLEPFDDTPATGLRAAMLIKPPSVSLSPSAKNVTNAPGSLVFTVSNTGGGALLWSATISAGVQRWARIAAITNDGNGGTITVDYDANLPGGALRTAVLTVTEIGATGAAATVTIEQAANPAPNGGGDGGGGAPTLPALALLAALLAAARRPRRQDSVMK